MLRAQLLPGMSCDLGKMALVVQIGSKVQRAWVPGPEPHGWSTAQQEPDSGFCPVSELETQSC